MIAGLRPKTPFYPMWSIPEAEDLAADVRRLFDELDRANRGAHAGTSLHAPALDVIETPSAIEVVIDLPGVARSDVRIVIKHGALIIAGEKHPPVEACSDGADFHLVERNFGRFARVVRFDHAVDAARARASFSTGVLRVSVPRIVERRGREIVIPIDTPGA